MSREIELSRGLVAIIDEEDYWLVSQFKWRANPLRNDRFYARTRIPNGDKKMYMHCLIAGFPPFHLDHINGDSLDNRRSNLRPATNSQNGANRPRTRNNKSGI